MQLRITPLSEASAVADDAWATDNPWPLFMRQDPNASLFYGLVEPAFADYVLLVEDAAEPGQVIAKAFAAPFVLGDGPLPDDGWDGVVRSAVMAKLGARTPDACSAIEITIRPAWQGKGLADPILAALREHVRRLGFRELVAPVRPNGKTDPFEPMPTYARRTRADGLPVDPWLRVHVRAGGVIERVAGRSMVITGTLDEWRSWTNLPFDTAGPVVVPKALAPVHCDVAQDHAVYIEPNVWVRHRLG